MVSQAELVFVRLAIPLFFGILCFSHGQGMIWFYLLTGIGITILSFLIILNLNYRRNYGPLVRKIAYCSFYILPFTLGGAITIRNDQLNHGDHYSKFKSDYLKVQIIEEPISQQNIINLHVKVLQAFHHASPRPVSGRLLLSIYGKDDQKVMLSIADEIKGNGIKLDYGDQLIIPANFRAISEPRNPYEFDLKSWYKYQNLHHQIFLSSNQVVKVQENVGNPVLRFAITLRKKQVNYYRKLLKGNEANAVASTLILGYRADLSEETLDAYSKTGTIHALSVSGMHVGLIYLVINFAFAFLDRLKSGRFVKFLLTLSLIWLYTLVAGMAPSVLRAAIMLSIYITGTTFKKHLNSNNLLCCAAFMMLLYNPFLIYDVGFQLSYLSVFGLIFLQPIIYGWFNFQNIALDKLWNFCALSFAAQLATFPLALYYFHQFPLYFLISNLFILLPVSIIMYLGLVILFLRADFLGSIFEWLINFNNAGLKWIAELPFASISGIWISKAELLLLSTTLIAGCLAFVFHKKRLVHFALTTICLLTISFSYSQYQTYRQKRVIFFSLNKNAAIGFIHRKKAWLLTDLPEDSKLLRRSARPALEQSGVRNITYLNIHQPFKNHPIQVAEHQVRFFDFHILLADSCFNHKQLQGNLQVDVINVGQFAKLNLEQLLMHTQTRQVIVDGTNHNFQAKRYRGVADKFEVPIYNLKNKKAYLVNLTK